VPELSEQPANDNALESARESMRRHAWREAFERWNAAAETVELGPVECDALAESAWWIGRLNDAIDARERAYAGFVGAGERARAARQAVLLGSYYEHRLAHPVSAGWFQRAEHLLRDQAETAEHGWLYRVRANAAVARNEYSEALGWAERVEDLGRRLGDRDLEALGLHDRGRILVSSGDVETGLSLLDEAMASAVGGELEPFPTAIIYCNVIVACQDLADYRRAADWTEAAKRWCERQSISGFPGMCRVRRAEVVRLRGAWSEAEREARQACAELQDFYLDYAGEGFYQIGEIRLRLGDHAGADDAFRQAHELGRSPHPGLSLLRLAQGDRQAASALIQGALDERSDRLGRAKLLPAAVEIWLAAHQPERAQAAAAELDGIAADYGSALIRATALTARGAYDLSLGAVDAAAGSLRHAIRLWLEIDAPYEAARTRLLFADALRAQGNADAAGLEAEAARTAFERLGAVSDAQRVPTAPESRAGGVSSGRARAQVRTFMFTDIVGSTRLVEAIGDASWGSLVRWHDRTLRSLFAKHQGEEVDHAGDGFFVAFSDIKSAMACAIEIQRSLEQHRSQHGFAPDVRIGLHTAAAPSGSRGYRGRGVHVAARIAAMASGGEILAAHESLRDVADYRVSEPRVERLKGIADPVSIVAVDWH
jgi:class 3 adenylate cyclase